MRFICEEKSQKQSHCLSPPCSLVLENKGFPATVYTPGRSVHQACPDRGRATTGKHRLLHLQMKACAQVSSQGLVRWGRHRPTVPSASLTVTTADTSSASVRHRVFGVMGTSPAHSETRLRQSCPTRAEDQVQAALSAPDTLRGRRSQSAFSKPQGQMFPQSRTKENFNFLLQALHPQAHPLPGVQPCCSGRAH